MIIKKEIYQPLILTIPEDSAFFSILNPVEEISKKIIMENYINFYSFRDPQYGNIAFRFENYMDYESIEGIERCFIAIDVMKKYYKSLDIIVELLTEGYAITVPVVRSCFSFYGKDIEGTHLVLIYGVDTIQNTLFCKDFSGSKFVNFNVSFRVLKKSLELYHRSFARESDGLLAFRINKKVYPNVDYARVYSEFYKLRQEYFSYGAAYGVGSINLVLNDIKNQPTKYVSADRWFNVVYYLLESSKLFNYRYKIFENELVFRMIEDLGKGKEIIKKLSKDTNLLFFKIQKLYLKKINVSGSILKDMVVLLSICRDDFKIAAEYFCDSILKFKYDCCDLKKICENI